MVYFDGQVKRKSFCLLKSSLELLLEKRRIIIRLLNELETTMPAAVVNAIGVAPKPSAPHWLSRQTARTSFEDRLASY